MTNDPRIRDPLYPGSAMPRGPAERPFDAPPAGVRSGSPGTSLAIAVLLVAALVVGISTLTGIGDDVDPIQTASPGIDRQETMLTRDGQPVPPAPGAIDAEAPALEKLPAD